MMVAQEPDQSQPQPWGLDAVENAVIRGLKRSTFDLAIEKSG